MLYSQTAKEFCQDSYQLISANSPTVPLQGNDMSKAIHFLNNLLKAYSSSSLLLTIAKEIVVVAKIGQRFITFGDPNFVPVPDVIEGRLSNAENAWLELDGVTYPLILEEPSAAHGHLSP